MSQPHPRSNQRASNEVAASVMIEQLRALQSQLTRTIQEAKIAPEEPSGGDGADDSTRSTEEALKRVFLTARQYYLCTLQSQLASMPQVVGADESTRSTTSLSRVTCVREAEKASQHFFLIARRYYRVEASGILHAVRSNCDRPCPSSIITSSGSLVKGSRTSAEILDETTTADPTFRIGDSDSLRSPTPEAASRKGRWQPRLALGDQRASSDVAASVLIEQLCTLQSQPTSIIQDTQIRLEESVSGDGTRLACVRETDEASEQFFLTARRYYSVESGGILHTVQSNSYDDPLTVTHRSDTLRPPTVIRSISSRVKGSRTSAENLDETTVANPAPGAPDRDGARGPPKAATRRGRRWPRRARGHDYRAQYSREKVLTKKLDRIGLLLW